MNWPGADPYNAYNPEDGLGRRSYYGLNWVPYMCIDGENDEGSTNSWQTHILNNATTTAPLEIGITGSFDYLTGEGACSVSLNLEGGPGGSHKLQVVLVEDGLYYMGSNGYPDHENVMRDMLPSSAGTTISLEAGVEITEEVFYQIPDEFDIDNCRLVVFVQNNSTHEVLNAATVYVTEIAPLNIPSLSVISTELDIIDDDGDSKLNPGETANFIVAVENACDWVDAEDVVGYLSTENPYVTILDDTGVYDLIVACDFIENDGDMFQISVSPEAPSVMDLDFELHLTANLELDNPYETYIPLTISMDFFQQHFPVAVSQPLAAGNAVIDLDGDGHKEIVVGGTDSLLHVYGLNGEEMTGFPFMTNNKIQGSPAVADIDNDGDLEVVIASREGDIYVVQHDGSGEIIATADYYLLGSPALTDFDDDGDLEIVVAGFGYDILALHHDGSMLPGFPVFLDGERMSCGVSLADLDADGVDEIVLGTWADKIHVFNSEGSELSGFPLELTDDLKAPTLIADIDSDNQLEILVGQDEGYFYAISATGTILWTHQLTTSNIRNAAAVLDFEDDGLKEIAYTAQNGFITVVDHLGNELDGWPQSVGSGCNSSPVAADLDGDGVPEIVVGSNDQMVYAFHSDGSVMENFPISVEGNAKGTATLADLDQDGNLEVVIGTDSELAVIDIKTLSTVAEMWNTARGDYRRTGAYVYDVQVSTASPINLPQKLTLDQNYPNPFNPTTQIRFGVPEAGNVKMIIYDVLGQEVSQLVNASFDKGWYEVRWNGLSNSGTAVEAGVYFAKISTGSADQVVKMMLLK